MESQNLANNDFPEATTVKFEHCSTIGTGIGNTWDISHNSY